jgi:hypothetical protein
MHENWTRASDWAGIQIQVRVNLYMMAAFPSKGSTFYTRQSGFVYVSIPTNLVDYTFCTEMCRVWCSDWLWYITRKTRKKVLMPVGKKRFEQLEQSAWLRMQARSTCALIRMPTLVANSAATCNEQHRSGRVGRKRNKNVTERVERVRVTTPIHLTLDWSCRRRTMFRVLGSDWPSDVTNRKGVWAQEWSTSKKR